MKFFFIIVLLSLQINVFGQNWTKMSNSNIKFSNFISKNIGTTYQHPFEYFKKEDTVIGVSSFISTDLYNLFEESPNAFSEIYKAAQFKMATLDGYTSSFDSTILGIDFKTAIIIASKESIDGYNEVIWKLQNLDWSGKMSNDPCYLNACFLKKIDRKRQMKLKFICAKRDCCEI